MKKGEIKQKQGFTIIEVVLVLAIAGLIFLMTFLALPALNRTQRDATRRDNISTFLRRLKEYQSNNRGALPPGETGSDEVTWNENESGPSWKGFYHDYLGETFQDPSGGYYKIVVAQCGDSITNGAECNNLVTEATQFPNDFKLMVFKSATCDGSKAEKTTNPRKVAVQYKLEGGGVYCANT